MSLVDQLAEALRLLLQAPEEETSWDDAHSALVRYAKERGDPRAPLIPRPPSLIRDTLPALPENL